MATPPRSIDRRVQRTRQLLQHAFMEIMQEKGFAAMNIQDITERANVNRGTFYAHFADKYALLDAVIREQFHHTLASKLPPTARWNRDTLRLLIQTVLEYFKEVRGHCPPSDALEPLIERATHEELAGLLLSWLEQGRRREARWQVPPETIARVISWAIFGAAAQWAAQEIPARSSEQTAHDVLLVLMEGAARLVPGELC